MPAAGPQWAAIKRLSSRPQGVRNGEVVEATGLESKQAGARLNQMVRTGKLTKSETKPRVYRWKD